MSRVSISRIMYQGADWMATTMSKSASTTKFVPMSDRVLIRRDDPKTMTEGGIYLPSKAADAPLIGTIIAVGDGRREGKDTIPVPFVKGDRVMFSAYAGTSITLDGIDLLVMREEEVIGILR